MAMWRITYHLLTIMLLLFSIYASISHVHAQCNAFGDPIVNITFGTDQEPMQALDREVIPGYVFSANGANVPGTYTIVSRGSAAGFIYHDFADHTEDDTNGRMLVVNANEAPGIFYTDIQGGLCPNTTFSFSAAIMNASPPSLGCAQDNNGVVEPINVLFEIQTLSGEVIASYETGVIHSTATPQWRPVSLTFDTREHTEIRLVMQNIGPGGCGNNIAIDDIQFRPCGPEARLLPQGSTIDADTVFTCLSSREVTFASEVGAGYVTEEYQWQQRIGQEGSWEDIPGETASRLTVEPVHNTWYRLAVASTAQSMLNPQCRVVSAPMRAAHARLPSFDPERHPERRTCVGTAMMLTAAVYAGPDVGPLSYQWYSHQGDNNWQVIAGAVAVHYDPDVSVSGTTYYQRRAVNVCGQDFVTDEFSVAVEEWQETTLDLPVTTVCLDDPAFLLSGGTPLTFNGDQPGVYSGVGVSNGYFNPAMAGVGLHEITYAPALSVLCPVPSTSLIHVVEPVEIDSMQDLYVLPGRSVRLQVHDNNGVAYEWDNASTLDRPNLPSPMATPVASTMYSVTVTNAGGCTASQSVHVHVLEYLGIPNTFTPNGDHINDIWQISGLDRYPDADVRVYNRWGTTVYTSNGYNDPWDGQFNGAELPAATYYYIISSSVLAKPLTGAVTILR